MGSRTRASLSFISVAALLAFSCTRMPTAPRAPVVVEGRVSGPAGEPLADAEVSFQPDDAFGIYGYARTDSLGVYSVRLVTGKYRVIVYPPVGYATPVHRAWITLSTNLSRYDVSFTGFHVTGRVTGPSDESIKSGFVSATLGSPTYDEAYSPLNDGAYSLLLPKGTYRFFARDNVDWSGLPAGEIEGVPIAADTTIDIRLDGFPISGVVVGPVGLPMENVGVEAGYTARNRTKSDGSYRLYVPAGAYDLWFRPPYPFYIFPRVKASMTIGGPVSIDCDLGGVEWTGSVRRLGTGDPASGIGLVVTQVGDEFSRGAAIESGPQGEFRFILEPNHPYDLRTYDPDTGERSTPIQGVAAAADTTFELFVP